VRGIDESTGKLALAMIGTGVLVGPVLGLWPLVGILAACGTFVFVAQQFKDRR
jgi:uncharacterized oligopeptide transporter (OPT) family protein